MWGFFEIEGERRDRAHRGGFAIGGIEGSLCREEVGGGGRGSGRSRWCDPKALLEKRLGTA